MRGYALICISLNLILFHSLTPTHTSIPPLLSSNYRKQTNTQVPLIDSGTTGYLGQVMPIMKGVTECYECR